MNKPTLFLRSAGRNLPLCVLLVWLAAPSWGRAQSAPLITGCSVLPDGYVALSLEVAPNVEHSFLTSTNLRDWSTQFIFESPSTTYAVTSPVPLVELGSSMFFRAATGRRLNFELNLQFHIYGGQFLGGSSPLVNYPATVHDYTANLQVEWETNPPPLAEVVFTGPAGSGLANAGAAVRYDYGDGFAYATPNTTTPPVPPPGNWQVVYRSATNYFIQPAPPAGQSLALPVPTVTVNGGLLYRVDWTYHNPTNGAVVNPPPFLEDVEVQIEGAGSGRIYNSEELPPDSTSHVLTDLIEWNEVSNLMFGCTDLEGRHYVVFYPKP